MVELVELIFHVLTVVAFVQLARAYRASDAAYKEYMVAEADLRRVLAEWRSDG